MDRAASPCRLKKNRPSPLPRWHFTVNRGSVPTGCDPYRSILVRFQQTRVGSATNYNNDSLHRYTHMQSPLHAIGF